MRELGEDVEERNYAKEPLTRKEVQRILKAAPSVAAVMNTRHKVVKERGWKEKAPSKKAFTDAVLEEPNLLKRPIVLVGDGIAIGKGEEAIRALFA